MRSVRQFPVWFPVVFGWAVMCCGPAVLAQTGKPTILAPAANDNLRGDGADGKNLIRWQTNQPPAFLYYVNITEVDQTPPHNPISSTVSIAIPPTQAIAEGGNTYRVAFDFNRSELAAMGSGLFRITLRAVDFGFDQTSDPVLYFKGRPVPDLTMNADNPSAVQFSLSAGDPDNTPQYTYRLLFERVGGGAAPGPLEVTTSAASVDQTAFTPLVLVPGADYNVTLQVTDTVNAGAGAGQGLTGQKTIFVHANAPPAVSIVSPTDGAVLPYGSLPASVPIQVTATDDGGGVIQIEIDIDGDNAADATGSVASGGTTTINVSVDNSLPFTARVRGTDDKGLASDYGSPRTMRVNLPPGLAVGPPSEGQVFPFAGSPTLVPVTVIASDSFDTQVEVRLDLDNDGVPNEIETVPVGVPTVIQARFFGPGPFTIRARAFDSSNAASPEVSRSIRLNTPPTVSVLAPPDGSTVTFTGAPTGVPFVVTAVDDFSAAYSVLFDLNDDGTADQTFPITNNTPTTVTVNFTAAGPYTLKVWARDGDNASGPQVTRTILLNDIPQVSIVSPADGARIDRVLLDAGYNRIDFTGAVVNNFANPIASYQWLFDGVPGGSAINASFVFGSLGNHTATLRATDAAGAVGERTIGFRLNDVPQAWLGSIQPSLYDAQANVYLVAKDQPTTVTVIANNWERSAAPLRLKLSITGQGAPVYLLSSPPANPAQPHQATLAAPFTFTATGDYPLVFHVGEDFGDQSTTGTLILTLRVVDALPSVNRARGWEGYR